jgi:UPF0716 protein FxsA
MPYVLLYLVVEIVAVVALGSWIGFGATVLVLLAGSVLGLLLARREGLRAAQALSQAVRDRKVATSEVTDGMLVAAGGLLLFVPGLVTDLAGLLLVLPPTRALVRRRLVRAAERSMPDLKTARIRSEGPIVDGDVVTEREQGGPAYRVRTLPRTIDGSADGSVVDGGVVVEGTVVDVSDDLSEGDSEPPRRRA